MHELADAQRAQLAAEQELHTLQTRQAQHAEADGSSAEGSGVGNDAVQEKLSKELQEAQLEVLKWKNDTRAALQAKDKAEAELEAVEDRMAEVQKEMDELLDGAGQVSEEETAKIKHLQADLQSARDAKDGAESEIEVFKQRIADLEEEYSTQNELMDELIAGQSQVGTLEGELYTAKAKAEQLQEQLEACTKELDGYKEAEAARAALEEEEAEADAKPSGIRAPGASSRTAEEPARGSAPVRRRTNEGGRAGAAQGGRSATPSRRTGQRTVATGKDGKPLPSYMQPTGARSGGKSADSGKSGLPKPGGAAMKSAKEIASLEKQLAALQKSQLELQGALAAKDDEIKLLQASGGSGGGASSEELEAAKAQTKEARDECTVAKQEAAQATQEKAAAVKKEAEANETVAKLREEIAVAQKAGSNAQKIGKTLLQAKSCVAAFSKEAKGTLSSVKAEVEVGKKSMAGMFANLNATVANSITAASKNAAASATVEVDEYREKYRVECLKRKKLYNQLQELKGNLRVYCRLRPPTEVEEKEGASGTVMDKELQIVKITSDDKGIRPSCPVSA